MPLLARVQAYAGSLALVAVSTLVGLWVAPRWGTAAVDMIYLPSVLAAAALWGIGPGLIAGITAALGYNFFFTEPIHSLRIDRVTDVVTVSVLFIVALVTSRLASAIRRQANLAAAHAERNATIAGFARRLLASTTAEQIARGGCEELHRLLGCNTVLVSGLPKPGIIASAPQDNRLTPSDVAAAALTLQTGETSGRATARIQPAEWQFHAISTAGGAIAAIGLARDDGAPPLNDDQRPLLDSLLDQLALALERSRLEADRQEIGSLRERDRLRSALLSSVGHDLRTPLTAIIGAAAELRAGTKDEALTATIAGEAAKLERYISNLLDMARIEAGTVKLKLEPVDLVDAIAAALKDLRTGCPAPDVAICIEENVPLVKADPQLLHHCLINLVDNAARHSGGGPIRLATHHVGGEVLLSVQDEGPGLPQDEERALDSFMRLEGSDRTGGAGLGLAIVKGFAEAMGLSALASNRSSGPGAIFTLCFPRSRVIAQSGAADAG